MTTNTNTNNDSNEKAPEVVSKREGREVRKQVYEELETVQLELVLSPEQVLVLETLVNRHLGSPTLIKDFNYSHLETYTDQKAGLVTWGPPSKESAEDLKSKLDRVARRIRSGFSKACLKKVMQLRENEPADKIVAPEAEDLTEYGYGAWG